MGTAGRQPFEWRNGQPGKGWWFSFKRRNKHVFFHAQGALSQAAATREIVDDFLASSPI